MNLPIGISKPALRALEAAGISKLEDFTSVSEEELLKLHGMGPKAIGIIAAALRAQGLDFANQRIQTLSVKKPIRKSLVEDKNFLATLL